MELSDHPRLYLQPNNVLTDSDHPFLEQCLERIRQDADRFATVPEWKVDSKRHNAHLVRAKRNQARILTLLVRWKQTGRERFRRAALQHVEQMGQWQYWSWIAWRKNDPAPDAIFDLSYGENSATLAIAYDILHDTLSAYERTMIVGIAGKHSFASGSLHCRPDAAHWFARPDSNWNTVCAGGLGMLCLAMYEDIPQAAEILPMVENSIAPFMHRLDRTDGGWPEGIGYWNYGMRYAFMYLLSHEAATGQPHPLLALEGVRKTLSFPIDFSPNGRPCSFGDSNRWRPLPFHHAAASRLERDDILVGIDSLLDTEAIAKSCTPDAAEWVILHSECPAQCKPAAGENVIKLYRGLDWGLLADRLPAPNIYLSVRGGSTNAPHTHLDLLSFHCMIDGELLLTNVNDAEYLDTTFSPRRNEIFEISPASKNTLLINGIGIEANSALDSTSIVESGDIKGFRLDATSAMGVSRDGERATEFCGRLILMLGERAFIVIDRVLLPHPGRIESRMHSPARVQTTKQDALIRGKAAKLRVVYDCNVPALLQTARPARTTPGSGEMTTLRWCTGRELFRDMTMAALLCPGDDAATVEIVEEDNAELVFRLAAAGLRRTIKTTEDLHLAGC